MAELCHDPTCPYWLPGMAGHTHLIGPDRPLGNGEEWTEPWSAKLIEVEGDHPFEPTAELEALWKKRVDELPDGHVEGELMMEPCPCDQQECPHRRRLLDKLYPGDEGGR